MTVLGTDQYGTLLSSTVRGAKTVKDLKGARQLQRKGLLPILLPSKMTFEDNYLGVHGFLEGGSVVCTRIKP
jgi:aspartokinase-like uncharacterized kinase